MGSQNAHRMTKRDLGLEENGVSGIVRRDQIWRHIQSGPLLRHCGCKDAWLVCFGFSKRGTRSAPLLLPPDTIIAVNLHL